MLLQVAAGFYHTIVLTGGSDQESLLLEAGQAMHKLSPRSILAHPAFLLPQGMGSDTSVDEIEEHVVSPEMNSPACGGEGRDPSQREEGIGFGPGGGCHAAEVRSGRCTLVKDSQIDAHKAAVIILAHMDRLAASFASSKGGVPIIGVGRLGLANDVAKCSPQVEGGGGSGDGSVESTSSLYCVEVCPNTFELLASVISSINEEQVGIGEEAYFQTYMIVAALRILKTNLARLLESRMSARIVGSMIARNTPLDANDTCGFQVEGSAGPGVVPDAFLLESELQTSCGDRKGGTSPTRVREYQRADQDREVDGTNRGIAKRVEDPGLCAELERYHNVLGVLRRYLLLLVHADPSNAESGAGTAEPVQRGAADVLLFGLELFYPCQIDQLMLLSKLMNASVVSDDDERTVTFSDVDSVGNHVYGLQAARYYILNPLLERLCNDALASKLIPYGANAGMGTVCTMVESYGAGVHRQWASVASADLMETQVGVTLDPLI